MNDKKTMFFGNANNRPPGHYRCHHYRRHRCGRRYGAAMLVVIMLVSLSMAVCYAVVYFQGTALRIGQNAGLRAKARQAAQAGLAVALRRACQSDWVGADSAFSRQLGDDESFHVAYSTGDAALSEGDDDYDEYPYRVTIDVSGHARDPLHEQRKATHKIRAVIRLIPQSVDDEPAGWNEIEENSFCQWQKDVSYVSLPCRIEGPARIRGELRLSEDGMDWSDAVRSYYYRGLNDMRYHGSPDYRPFDGPLQIARWEQSSDTLDLLENALAVELNSADTSTVYSWSMPLESGSYRLYPGGKTYYAEPVDAELADVELKADPKTNPLGIFISDGETRFYGNVSLEGTLISDGDVKILAGANTFTSVSAPPYSHREVPEGDGVRLAAVIAGDDFVIEPGAGVLVEGLLMVRDELEAKSDSQCSMVVAIQGKLMAKRLDVKPRTEWQLSKDWWNERLATHLMNFGSTWQFPEYLIFIYALDPQPQIYVRPDEQKARYHWYNADNPLFRQCEDSDGNAAGLRWELISWQDNP